MKTSFIDYFLYLLKNFRLTGSQNVLNFGMKSSKSRRFLGLCPRPRWGSLRRSPVPDALVVRGFLPSAIAASHLQSLFSPPNKNSRPVSPHPTPKSQHYTISF